MGGRTGARDAVLTWATGHTSVDSSVGSFVDSWDHPRTTVGVDLMCGWALEHQVARTAVLAGTGIDAAVLNDPAGMVEARQELAVLRNLLSLLPDHPGLGVALGSRFRVTAYGPYGYLLLTCATWGEASRHGLAYAPLTFAFCTISARVESGLCVVDLAAPDLPEDLRRCAVERDLTAVVQLARDLFPHQRFPIREVHFAFPEVSDFSVHEAWFGVPVRFDQPHSRIVYDADFLDAPLPMANRQVSAQMREQCDRLRAERLHSAGTAARVRTHLLAADALDLSLDDVALALNVAPRTLRRHLDQEGTSFRDVLDEVRQVMAETLLRDRTLSRHAIAARLGYHDWSTLARARRRWSERTGHPGRE